jgi:hypothetical protein
VPVPARVSIVTLCVERVDPGDQLLPTRLDNPHFTLRDDGSLELP